MHKVVIVVTTAEVQHEASEPPTERTSVRSVVVQELSAFGQGTQHEFGRLRHGLRPRIACVDLAALYKTEKGLAILAATFVSQQAGRFGTEVVAHVRAELIALASEVATAWPTSPDDHAIQALLSYPIYLTVRLTARNRAIDRVRRETTRAGRHAAVDWAVQAPPPPNAALEGSVVEDDRLRLIFTCCHPALAPEAQVALTLRLLGGLETTEIARAFLVSDATMSQRIVRAKRKIRDARIPYRVPRADELSGRLSGVLAVVYLIFNEGYASTVGGRLVRPALCDESIRLARGLAELMPAEPEVLGLLALMLLADSRRDARVSSDGALVPLATRDRSRWDRLRIAEGQAIVRRCLQWNRPGPYQIQAAIQAVHSDAPVPDATDWRQVVALYDQLLVLAPTPVVALNRATALAELGGPEAGLHALDGLALDGYHLLHAVRADLLQRVGRTAEARAAVDRAIELCANDVERELLERRRRDLPSPH